MKTAGSKKKTKKVSAQYVNIIMTGGAVSSLAVQPNKPPTATTKMVGSVEPKKDSGGDLVASQQECESPTTPIDTKGKTGQRKKTVILPLADILKKSVVGGGGAKKEFSHLSRQLSAGESVDGKMSTAKNFGPTVSQMKTSSWIDRPKNDDPAAGKEIRKKLLGCAIVVLIVNLVVVAYILTFFLSSPDNSPLDGITRGNVIPNMTELCRQKYGVCAYFSSKFVRNCIEEICSTVMLEAFMTRKVPQGFRLGLKKQGAAMTIRVPDDTPCLFGREKKVGMCYQGLCYHESKDVALLSNYSNDSVVNGGWKLVEPSVDNCLSIDKEILDFYESSRVRSCTPVSLNCPVVSYVRFRSCTAPVPSTGGAPCWKEGLYTKLGLDLAMKNDLGLEIWRNLPLTLNNCTIDRRTSTTIERSKSCAINVVLSETVGSSAPECPAKHCGADLTLCQLKPENYCRCVWGFCSDLDVYGLITEHNAKA